MPRPSVWEKLKAAGSELAAPIGEPDMYDATALPNEQMASRGMLNALNAWSAMAPDPVFIGNSPDGQPMYMDPTAFGGGLKIKSPALYHALGRTDIDPSMLSHKDWGKAVKKAAEFRSQGKDPIKNIRDVFSEIAGARAVDKFGTSNPEKIIKSAWEDMSLDPAKSPPVTIISGIEPLSPAQKRSHGLYFRGSKDIELMPEHYSSMRPKGDPSFLLANVANHEANHAIDYAIDKSWKAAPEVLGSGPKRDNFAAQGFYSTNKIKDLYSFLKNNPDAISRENFEALGNALTEPQMREAMNQIFRDSQFAANPYLAQRMKSSGHFKNYGSFEAEFPQVDIARQKILAGDRDIHPQLKDHPLVQKAIYDSNMPFYQVPPNYGRQSESSPWAKLAAGIGLAALPFVSSDSQSRTYPAYDPEMGEGVPLEDLDLKGGFDIRLGDGKNMKWIPKK